MKKTGLVAILMVVLFLTVLFVPGPHPVLGQEMVKKSKGQTVLITTHPQIYIDRRGATTSLTTTLMVQNTDQDQNILLASVKFYDSSGTMIKELLPAPKELTPLSSLVLLLNPPQAKVDKPGASILIEWTGQGKTVNSPLMDSIAIGAEGNQGISFHNTGIVLKESGN